MPGTYYGWYFLNNLFWFILLFLILTPMINQWNLERTRLRLLQSIERRRGSRVITLIHRQESFSFLGLAFSRFINIEDSEQILRAIRMTPQDMPIDLIVHTPGGLVLAAEQIASALKKHKAKVTVFVPHYAMSGGTLIALAADEIVMDENAVMGPVDPQLGQYPAASILRVLEKKDINEVDDQTLILADIAKKAIDQVYKFVYSLLEDKMGSEKADKIARALTEGRWTHDYPLTYDELKEMGLPVSKEMPEEVFALMELYPQTSQRRPSVQYIPLPYHKEANGRRGDNA
ncbi:MAG: ATP-dependent Clp protease proteolytic subunit [Synergistetes bacterium]|nr:ATP-dependent Clp protease proteolytic subunit [Synergistota bacterium]